jgi:hypothetical protein
MPPLRPPLREGKEEGICFYWKTATRLSRGSPGREAAAAFGMAASLTPALSRRARGNFSKTLMPQPHPAMPATRPPLREGGTGGICFYRETARDLCGRRPGRQAAAFGMAASLTPTLSRRARGNFSKTLMPQPHPEMPALRPPLCEGGTGGICLYRETARDLYGRSPGREAAAASYLARSLTPALSRRARGNFSKTVMP